MSVLSRCVPIIVITIYRWRRHAPLDDLDVAAHKGKGHGLQ
jgi:hypothetical protein